MDRRTVLRTGFVGAAGFAAARLTACTVPTPPEAPDAGRFDCGVASGIHSSDAAVLWTRFAPAAVSSVAVAWEIARDPGFAVVVDRGEATASPAADGCVKVLAEGLTPGTRYWYRFSVDGWHSPVGHTKTPGDDATANARFAVASCQQFAAGYYSVWRAISQVDLDAVIFLGDYIYESGGGSWPISVRRDTVGTADDLASYRAKYRLYRSDADLQAAHAAHAFIPVWDDHELVNDFDRTTITTYPERAAGAFQAWWEYQPVMPIEDNRIFRGARWGRVVDLSMLDTRQYRDPPIKNGNGDKLAFGDTSVAPLSEVHSPSRTILGAPQRDWLLDRLGAAQDDGVRWKVIGNQVMISPIRIVNWDQPAIRSINESLPRNAGIYVNFDDWNGFFADRDRLTTHLADEGVSDVAFVTGDVHHFFQAPVRRELDGPVIAQEYTCGSVSSRGVDFVPPAAGELANLVRGADPGFAFTDFEHRGFGLLECTPERMSVDFVRVDALDPATSAAAQRRRRSVRFEVAPGANMPQMSLG